MGALFVGVCDDAKLGACPTSDDYARLFVGSRQRRGNAYSVYRSRAVVIGVFATVVAVVAVGEGDPVDVPVLRPEYLDGSYLAL